jgi:hypothetical protein
LWDFNPNPNPNVNSNPNSNHNPNREHPLWLMFGHFSFKERSILSVRSLTKEARVVLGSASCNFYASSPACIHNHVSTIP